MSTNQQASPLTGVIEEDRVFVDFGEHEGKSVFEIQCTLPDYYEFLMTEKEKGNFYIRRNKDKIFRLYVQETPLN